MAHNRWWPGSTLQCGHAELCSQLRGAKEKHTYSNDYSSHTACGCGLSFSLVIPQSLLISVFCSLPWLIHFLAPSCDSVSFSVPDFCFSFFFKSITLIISAHFLVLCLFFLAYYSRCFVYHIPGSIPTSLFPYGFHVTSPSRHIYIYISISISILIVIYLPIYTYICVYIYIDIYSQTPVYIYLFIVVK